MREGLGARLFSSTFSSTVTLCLSSMVREESWNSTVGRYSAKACMGQGRKEEATVLPLLAITLVKAI